jgi:hypothetical protein
MQLREDSMCKDICEILEIKEEKIQDPLIYRERKYVDFWRKENLFKLIQLFEEFGDFSYSNNEREKDRIKFNLGGVRREFYVQCFDANTPHYQKLVLGDVAYWFLCGLLEFHREYFGCDGREELTSQYEKMIEEASRIEWV